MIPIQKFKKETNRTLDSPFLLRQGEPGTSQYIHVCIYTRQFWFWPLSNTLQAGACTAGQYGLCSLAKVHFYNIPTWGILRSQIRESLFYSIYLFSCLRFLGQADSIWVSIGYRTSPMGALTIRWQSVCAYAWESGWEPHWQGAILQIWPHPS